MIKQAKLTFINEDIFKKRDAEKLRGFFGNLYKEEDLFHNHKEDGKSIYRMPLIQYKVVDGKLTIVAFEKGYEFENPKGYYNNILKIEFNVINDKIEYKGISLEEFYIKKLDKYLYSSGSSRGGDNTPTTIISKPETPLDKIIY